MDTYRLSLHERNENPGTEGVRMSEPNAKRRFMSNVQSSSNSPKIGEPQNNGCMLPFWIPRKNKPKKGPWQKAPPGRSSSTCVQIAFRRPPEACPASQQDLGALGALTRRQLTYCTKVNVNCTVPLDVGKYKGVAERPTWNCAIPFHPTVPAVDGQIHARHQMGWMKLSNALLWL